MRYKWSMSTSLEALVAEAQKEGWAAGSGTPTEIQREARMLGLTEVPLRRGGPAMATLRPLERSAAPANSLSARYGTGGQPLHTDGAHLVQPPDLLILVCEVISTTPTRLWRTPRVGRFTTTEPEHARHGIFLVSNGKDSFFSPAYTRMRFRYDPGCMTPCDARAWETVRYFEKAMEDAVEHQWDEPDSVLVIDNRQALHARASAADEPEREIHRVAYRVKDGAS